MKRQKTPDSVFPTGSNPDSVTHTLEEPIAMEDIPLATRFEASLVLSGVGDAIGYKNGSWEFAKSGNAIHKEAKELGGLENLHVKSGKWMVSDDTVMHLATGEAFVNWDKKSLQSLYTQICKEYVKCWDDMSGRAPGIQCGRSMPYLKRGHWDGIPFSPAGGGCGAAMRTMCIGLVYAQPSQLDDLIAVSIESGRMTHNHPTGFLGGVVAALFSAYAIQKVPVVEWGRRMVNDVLPKCVEYLKKTERNFAEYSAGTHLTYFVDAWKTYLAERQIANDGQNTPVFPEDFGVSERDKFYKQISFSGWGGSSGHDSVIIAYDALLGSGDDWIEFLKRGALHGGDSDSTAAIGAAWFGALYGYKGVPEVHYKDLEYGDRLKNLAEALLKVAQMAK